MAGGGTSAKTITGRVCLVTDPRFLATCATTGAGRPHGLDRQQHRDHDRATVRSSMPQPTAGITSTVSVTGSGIVPSTTSLNTNAQIPVINQALFDMMVLQTGIVTTHGSGSILATVSRRGEPVANVTAVATPAPDVRAVLRRHHADRVHGEPDGRARRGVLLRRAGQHAGQRDVHRSRDPDRDDRRRRPGHRRWDHLRRRESTVAAQPAALTSVSASSAAASTVGDDAAADVHAQLVAVDHADADRDRELERAARAEVAERAAVRAAPRGLELVDQLHRADLRRAGDRAAGERRAQQRRVAGARRAASR